MILSSIPFALFFAAFFALYWILPGNNPKARNILILAGSYLFYAWGDRRFLPLLITGSALNYGLGLWIEKTAGERARKLLVLAGLIYGLGSLAYFKYAGFFLNGLNDFLSLFQIGPAGHPGRLLLPLGISFYTFRTIGYLLDVSKGKTKAETDPIVFFAYVAFFPSLISGPIDKAKSLIPQMRSTKTFDYEATIEGMRQILWGLFKKTVVADNCAALTTEIFGNYQDLPASSLLLGAFLYTIQIYADFSGYSDMALGVGRMLGFSLTKNFDYPFFSQNIAEYWRKWHISLTAWLTEYVFTPLAVAFRDYGKPGLILAVLINFTLIGIWHGANWTFVLFGFLHGCYFIPLIVRGTLGRKTSLKKQAKLPTFREFLNMSATFLVVMLTLILFRAESVPEAFHYLRRLPSASLISAPALADKPAACLTLFFIIGMLLLEWFNREKEYPISRLDARLPLPLRWAAYYALLGIIFVFAGSGHNFIYVQF